VACNFEAPSVEALHKEFGDSVVVMGVAWAGTESSYVDFVHRHELSFPSVDDSSGALYARYKVPNQPAWVFLRDGSARTVLGSLEPAEVRKEVKNLIAA
jgi:peroxiredoxin